MTGTPQERADKYERVKALANLGCTYSEIAKRVGIHPFTAYNIVVNELVVVVTPRPYDLTSTEIATCKLLIDGKNNSSIASIRGISRRTVDSHIENIYRKLQLTNALNISQRVVAVMMLKDLI